MSFFGKLFGNNKWSTKNGRSSLLSEPNKAEVGQLSVADRSSVGRIDEPDLAQVASIAQAQALAEKGQLARLLMFPPELGGEDVEMNVLYVPPGALKRRAAHIETLVGWAQEGAIDKLNVRPEYKGTSFIPSRIHMDASHSESGEQRTLTLEVW